MISPESIRGLQKALYIVSNDLRGKKMSELLYYRYTFVIFGITLSIC